MRLFGVQKDGRFTQYVQTPFRANHAEAVLEDWPEQNPNGIVEDSKLLMIGGQVTTDLGSIVDLLALDRQGDVMAIELKRDRTPRETLAQALEYASSVEGLDGQQLEEILRSYLNDEAVRLAEYHTRSDTGDGSLSGSRA
jgi:RecB family endonuclease NucS